MDKTPFCGVIFALCCLAAILATCASCGPLELPDGSTATGTLGFYRSATPGDPGAEFGLLLKREAPAQPAGAK